MIQLAAGFWKWVVYRQLSLHMRLAHVRSVTKVKRNLRRSCMRTLAAGYAIWARATVVDVQATLCAKLRSEKARNGLFSRLATSMHDPLRALKRLEHSGEWRSLRTWKVWTDAASAAEERRAVAATKALSTLCRVEGRFLRLGWRTWTLFCRASLKCERLCKRWTHAVEFRAMRSWALFVAAAKSQARAVSLAVKVLGRLRRADEFAAWRRWEAHNVAVVVERQAAAIRAMRESDACIRALRLLGDASLRVVNRRFAMWATNVGRSRSQQRKMRAVFLHMVLRQQSQGLRTWRWEAAKRSDVRRKTRRVVSRMIRARVEVGWHAWRTVTRRAATDEGRISERRRRAFVRMTRHVALQR